MPSVDMFRPMLACEADLTKLKFPLLASAKLDGVRAVVRDGVVYSRSNKPIPNEWVQRMLGRYEHYDGELIVGEPTSKSCYRDTVSHVMSHDKLNFDLRFYVFDHVQNLAAPYIDRLKHVKAKIMQTYIHDQHVVHCLDTLLNLEESYLADGYEGLILRDPNAPYKRGRSTMKEGYLLKLKRFVDAEATVIGFEERMHNGNVAETNELGRTKRSSHQANKSGRGDLGALVVRMDGVQFNIGTGFDDAERATIWDNQADYLNRLVKFKFFPVGVKEAPRHPVYLGWRSAVDMS
jgi:DNA ligase-1